ncbi:MAG: cell division protein FtsL [Acidobacteria bacterium]|nr:cell division protein FtsL [Acidobacteriota bacterium]
MATIAASLPRPRKIRKLTAERVGGRATLPDVYYLKPIDNSRLRREVDRGMRRECYCLLGLGLMVFLFLLVFAWQSFAFVRDGYQVESARTERESLEEWNRQLRIEHAALADPQRIDALAKKDLGLALPQPHQVIRLEGESLVADPGPAQVAQNHPVSGEIP